MMTETLGRDPAARRGTKRALVGMAGMCLCVLTLLVSYAWGLWWFLAMPLALTAGYPLEPYTSNPIIVTWYFRLLIVVIAAGFIALAFSGRLPAERSRTTLGFALVLGCSLLASPVILSRLQFRVSFYGPMEGRMFVAVTAVLISLVCVASTVVLSALVADLRRPQ